MTGLHHDSTRRRRLRPWVKQAIASVAVLGAVCIVVWGACDERCRQQTLVREVASLCGAYCARNYGIARPQTDLPVWIAEGERLPDLRGKR